MRLNLDAAAKQTLRWAPTLKAGQTTRAALDKIRKRIERDVEQGKLVPQPDGTIDPDDLGSWARRVWWAKPGRLDGLADLPGKKLEQLERLANKKGELHVRMEVSVRHDPRLPSTVEECHAEILRLCALLDDVWRQHSSTKQIEELEELRDREAKRQARSEAALKAIKRQRNR